MRRKIVHRSQHAGTGQLDAGKLQAHFAARQRGHQRQVIAVAQVADAEHFCLELAQAGAQRAVEALINDLAYGVGVNAFGRHHAGENG